MLFCSPLSPQNLFALFLNYNRHYKFYIFKLPNFLCFSEAMYKPLVSVVLIVWRYWFAILFPNYIQFFQYRIWGFLTKKWEHQNSICFQLKWNENIGYTCFLLKNFLLIKICFCYTYTFMHINSIYKVFYNYVIVDTVMYCSVTF